MKKFQINLFGRFSLTSESRPVSLPDSSAHLLAYLALSHGRHISRSRTAGALWPDLSEARARANLSTTIWRLRRALLEHGCSVDVIHPSTDSLELNMSSCDVDVDTFVRATVSPGTRGLSLDTLARAVHALDLYKGELLEDWDVEWCRLEREELRKRYVHTLHALSEGFEQRGRNDLAILYARRAAQADPLNEAIQRTLMRLLYRTGDKVSAVTQFNRFVHLTKSELGVEPDRETISLAREIRRPSSPDESSMTLQSRVPMWIRPERIPLIGRDIERLELNALLDAAVAARGGGVLLVGEAGIGKSKLADWVMEEWAARGGAAGRGRCIEFNEPVPYQPLLDALGSFVDEAELSGFVSGDGRPTAQFLDETVGHTVGRPSASETLWPPGKLRLFARLRSYLEDASRRRPLLAVIEDLQWADAGTVDFLVYLLERAKAMRLAVLLTSRPSGASIRHRSYLERLSRHCGATLRVGALSVAETTRLVKSLLEGSGASPALATWVHAETEGNPLFIVETMRLLQRQGNIETSPGKASRDAERSILPSLVASIPAGVRLAVEQRLAIIEPRPYRVAQIASVIGRSFDEDLLGIVLGARRNRVSRAIGQLLQEGIFEREGSGYRFSHDKIRAVCYENLSKRARGTYHARTAAALVQISEVPIHRLAWHQLCAGQWNLAASSWEQAGDHAYKVHAYEEALAAYRHAALCIRRDSTGKTETADIAEIRLLVKSDEALAIQGRLKERRILLDRLGVLSQRVSQISCQAVWFMRRALLEEHVGNFDTARNLARRAWDVAKSGSDRSAEIDALRVLSWMFYRVGMDRRSIAISRLALRKMEGAKSPSMVRVLWQTAISHITLTDYASALAYAERAHKVSMELGLTIDHEFILLVQGIANRFSGDLVMARSKFHKAKDLAKESGNIVLEARMDFYIAALDTCTGKLGEALRGLRRAIVSTRFVGPARTYMACLNEVTYGIGRLLGNREWAWNASAHAVKLCRASGNKILSANYEDSQARLLLEEGRLEEAMAVAVRVVQDIGLQRSFAVPYGECLATRGMIFLALGELTEAIADLDAVRRVQVQMGDRVLLVDTLTYLALAYAKTGNAERALSTSEETLELLDEIDNANMQPQRIFWHHYHILEMFDREPRVPYLKRAVEFIEAQAATLSKAQARRFKRDVRLNHEILEAWERQQGLEPAVSGTASLSQTHALPMTAAPATEPAYAPLVLSA